MEYHARRNSRPSPSPANTVRRDQASPQRATEVDRETLRVARQRCERQMRWGRRSMIVGLFLGPAALLVACCVKESSFRWALLIAAAVELGFVPFYTTLACRRLRYIVALIDRDLEEGLVEHGVGRIQKLLGAWPVLADTNTPRVWFAPVGPGRFRRLRGGAPVAYRFATRSRVVVSVEREDHAESRPRAESEGR
ncbi:MAG TPA: hypothetical protein VHC22_17565 [Pirellulales bacterium]|nr:hypothetical protein [Pirellulales bacterium]